MKQKAHVVHLSTVHPVQDVRIMVRECRSLARHGYRVTYVAPAAANSVDHGVNVVAIKKPKRRAARIAGATMQAYRAARALDADLYHFHDPELLFVGLMLRWAGKRVVYDAHEDAPRQMLHKQYMSAGVRRAASAATEMVENFVVPRLSAVVAATPTIQRRFARRNSNTVVVNNYPLLEELAQPAGEEWQRGRGPDAGYVGGISLQRGAATMVDAMALVGAKCGARLQLAGRFLSAVEEEAVGARPGWQYVDYLGWLDRGQVGQLLRRIRVGLVLFGPTPNNMAGQPTKMFEYMSASVPVIASDYPVWRPFIEGPRCGYLVDPQNAEGVAAAIENVLSNPQEAEAMGRRGREAVEREYNWSIEEAKLLSLYERLLG